MIDIKLIREQSDEVVRRLARRGGDEKNAVARVLALDQDRRHFITQAEEKKAQRNSISKEIGKLKQQKLPADEMMAAMRVNGEEISQLDEKVRAVEAEMEDILLRMPNLPDNGIPDSENGVVKAQGETPKHGTPHWDIATKLGLVDFERGVKVAGARFYALKGLGARLERALIAYMLDLHIDRHGYTEVMPPFLVNLDSMRGTGQYPKFAEEYFTCERDGLALAPTAEVPVTNLHRDEILAALPIKYCAYTPCFRREAGAAGKDTRGLIRVHQFNKIELVKYVRPEDSMAELESLTRDAEEVLEGLGLPYRRLILAANDLGFASTKTYDLEVWMPGLERYVEISSCSNFVDYQARRMKIRFKRDQGAKPELVHTLNGSGLAVGRTFAAILENGLRPDGSVAIPAALQPYMKGLAALS